MLAADLHAFSGGTSQWRDALQSVFKSHDSLAFIIETDEDDLPLQPLR